MPNSFVSSLPALSLSSVTNAEFYMASSGTNRKTTISNLQAVIPGDQSTDLTLTTAHVTVSSARTTLPFDVASRDPRGMFNAASAGLVQVDFTGWAKVYCSIHVSSDAIDNFDIELRKNGNTFFGGLYYSRGSWTGKNDLSMDSHVFTVTSGDYLEMQYFTGTSMTIVATTLDGPNRFIVKPVGIRS